jgi:lysozyme
MATKTSTNTRRKTTAARRSSSPRSKKKTQPRTMPVWLRNLLAVCIILVFSTGFYWFFIRPYAYRRKPCYGQKGYGVCMPCNYEVHGIDISHYQGEIDWELLTHNREAKFPIHFIFLKATEGGDHGDDTFTQNFGQARKYGFIRGAYHYFIPKTDAHKQADFFIRTVQLAKGDLPPVLDVETTGKQSPQELKTAVKTWLDRVEAHYGVKPILYTSYKFKKRYLSDSIFNAYPYWIAHYYVDSVRYEGKWHFWQHTDVGTVPGIEEEVDLNVFNGTMEELLELTLKTPCIER